MSVTVPRVKVCGCTRVGDVRAAVRAGADAVGVIVDVPVDTPREVAPDRAAELFEAVPPFVTAVLVTMTDDPNAAADLVDRTDPDAVQIHSGLSPSGIDALSASVDVDVIAAVDAAEPEIAADYDDVADVLLVDSVDDDGGGGTGETHDWERTREATVTLSSPLLLAGGLTPDNVGDAVRTVSPFGVDVASGVEREGGIKDHAAIEAFVRAATRREVPA